MPEAAEPVEFVALERGFFNGALVAAGKTFTYAGDAKDFGAYDDKGNMLRKPWAVPVKSDEAGAPVRPKPVEGDTKPLAARAAVKAKAGALNGDSPA